MNILDSIHIILPEKDTVFTKELISFLSPVGKVSRDTITFTKSVDSFVPTVSFSMKGSKVPRVIFHGTHEFKIESEIVNSTGKVKDSPHSYEPIELKTVVDRLTGRKMIELDHTGFNLPWFDGIHPEILKLRTNLGNKSIYKLFPTGEPWDFILPASRKEIIDKKSLDYSVVRRPKFEIVSFDKSSQPLIQFDLQIKEDAQIIQKLFPEGIYDPRPNNVWVYLKNPYDLDICLVLNEWKTGDWSEFFTSYPPSQSQEG